ncbi:Vesicle trafficking between the ER and Golgi [Borealophlyctis nickersoniae]|nr:Vesicle trafficking between the ER and Golgi [Borealophlyctis nickersoniae]
MVGGFSDAIISMLNLNNRDAISTPSDGPGLAITEPVWKVLIYDQLGQDIISPLLKVNDLRENGVTVHMPLFSDRQPIPDVPAIYFIQPTAENIRRLADDFSRHIYESYYINFSYSIPRPLLEDLAAATVKAGVAAQIAQVYDQYLNFVCLEPNLFSLQLDNSYRILNDPTSSDSSIEGLTDRIVASLFSALVTMGVVPVIRAPRGNAAAQVATKLNSRLRDHVMNARAELDSPAGMNLTRPDMKLNRVVIYVSGGKYVALVHPTVKLTNVQSRKKKGAKSDEKCSILTSMTSSGVRTPFRKKVDPKASTFPEDVDTEINRYKSDVAEVTRACGVDSLDQLDPNDFGANARGLSVAIKRLPELTERKRILDMHMKIATNLFKTIQDRHLDQFFSMEEAIGKQTKATILEALKDPKKLPEDKMRLFIMFYLSVEDVSKDDFAEYEAALTEAGCNVAALHYVKQIRAFFKMTAMSNVAPAPQSTASDFFGKVTSIGSKFTDHLKDAGVAGSFDHLISGVKNLLPTRKDLPATRIVESVMDGVGGEVDDYLYLDPKLGRDSNAGKQPKNRTVFQDALVFVVGGGNYLEYQNLVEHSQRSPGQKKRIVYGSTELLTAKGFMEQLEALGTSGKQ